MATRILFVCMGNICRSPLAECMFRKLLSDRNIEHLFEIDSAGTSGFHAGDRPDARMRAVGVKYGLAVDGTSRQVTPGDFEQFDHLICMDEDNREQLLSRGAPETKLRLLLDCDPQGELREVPDPYYGDGDGFELNYRLVKSACAALLDELLSETSPQQS